MYINHCVYKPLDQRARRQQPRDRYVTYFEDLYRISDKTLSTETFVLGDQYSYTDIIDEVLAEGLPFDECRSVSDVVFSYWTPEWDPSYSAFGTYFLWKSELDAEIFDVCDVGSIATTTALHLLFNMDDTDDVTTKVVVGLEQTSVPRNLAEHNIMPTRSSGSALFVSNGNDHGAFCKLEDSVYINENLIYQEQYALANAIGQLLLRHDIDSKDCALILKRVSRAYKELDYLTDKRELEPTLLGNAVFVPNNHSVNELAALLATRRDPANADQRPYRLYLDEDAESLNTTITLLRML